MRRSWRTFLAVSFLFLAAAAAGVDARADDCGVLGDPFAPSGLIPKGPMKGKCFDISKYRSFGLLTHEEAAKVVPADVIADSPPELYQFVSNVGHDGEWWVMRYPKKEGIEAISLLIERFGVKILAAHSMMRVDFKPGMEPEIFSQTTPGKRAKLPSFVLTIDGKPAMKAPLYAHLGVVGSHYVLIKNLVSLEQRVKLSLLEQKNAIKQYRLHFDGKHIDDFWNFTLKTLNDPKMTQMYDLFSRNCMNGLFVVIDGFLGKTRNWMRRWTTFLPNIASGALKKRHILDPQVPIERLEREVTREAFRRYCPNLFRSPRDAVGVD